MNIKRTKIIATLGPATADKEKIAQLVRAGVNAFRLNFSHGTYKEHARLIRWIKQVRRELDEPVAILQDLGGPKIRVGIIEPEPLRLVPGDRLIFDPALEKNRGKEIPLSYPDLARDVAVGKRLVLADGSIELLIEAIDGRRVICQVLNEGVLSSHKGLNYPEGSFRLPALTEKDRQDLAFGLQQGVDWVALSFVRSREDIQLARQICRQHGCDVPLIAKIEKHEAVNNFLEIVEAVDGVMVARGDLGVEIPLEKVPLVQKKIIRLANLHGKPVITATQMLLSMVHSPRPTRAEVTDIANAILDGSDAIMLSDETAMGKYPLRAVQMMSRIALETEKQYPFYSQDLINLLSESGMDQLIPEAISHSASILSRDLGARLIICPTNSGFTAKMISRFRPQSLLLALTPSRETYYRLALMWGVVPRYLAIQKHSTRLIENALKHAYRENLLKRGDVYVITAGFPFGQLRSTNLITAGVVGETFPLPEQ
ncbi:MAG: pyruvate kinase [Calditrichaeota bacterium]|nr:MAG: pyruvate kinase [Calditrichota bacterium]